MDLNATAGRTSRLLPDARKKDVLPYILLFILFAGVLAVLAGALLRPHYQAVPALLWSLGFCVSGMLLGFLFGIPRSLPSEAMVAGTAEQQADAAQRRSTDQPDAAETADGPGNSAAARNTLFRGAPAPMEINSNLVEVSDWLTKIIVGVGLIELKSLPAAASSLAGFIAPSLAVDQGTARSVVGAIMLFFSVHGFLIGYLLTRIYLSIMIKRADNQVKNESVRLDSGKEIDVSELSRLQQKSLEDMQEAVTQLLLAGAGNAEGAGTTGSAALAGTAPVPLPPVDVLWVDDHPRNNTLLIEHLGRENIKVDMAQSTSQALSLLGRKPYGLLITDMARLEGGRRQRDAGVQTVRAVRQLQPLLPIVVYCSKDTVLELRRQAETEGASFITTSGTGLLAGVKRLLEGRPA